MKARRARGIFLPWEQRNAWLRDLVTGKRWKSALLAGLGVALATFVWKTADVRARTRATRAAIAEVQQAMLRFRAQVGRCPRSRSELIEPPRSFTRQLRAIPTDGWGRPLYIRCPSRVDPTDVDVVSAGPSGSFFVDDNIR